MEGDFPLSDLTDIFGDDFSEKNTFPALNDIKEKLTHVLNISQLEADTLIAEANQAEHFNVYSALKHDLIKLGIPEDQIAFIHDFKTRKQRDSIYSKVNKGEVRVFIGSTIKLGTGVNVQERVVALHHLDISWKPSHIEQRNGRGARQGNWLAKETLNNTVPAFYYATERTLDASMYNTVSLKAKFIAQTKIGNTLQRSVKDIGEEDVDMGSMAAELSGDPIFKEKATLTKEINELTQLQRSFLQKKYNTEDNMRTAERLIPFYEKQIEGLTNSLPLLDKIPKDKNDDYVFSATVNGVFYDKFGDATRAMLNFAGSKKESSDKYSFLLATVWGFPVMAERNLWTDSGFDRQIKTPFDSNIGTKSVLSIGELAAALQIKEHILAIPYELTRTKEKLVSTKENLIIYRQQITEQFPYLDQLTEKTARLLEVDKIVAKRIELERKDKKPNSKQLAVDNPGEEKTAPKSNTIKINN